jgi:GNAT superfamily N-acetyltransferase
MIMGQKERWIDSYHFNLVEMCVLPKRQRAGIGGALLQYIIAELERERTGKVYLITAPEGPAAAFYSKLGFYASRGRVVMARNLGA